MISVVICILTVQSKDKRVHQFYFHSSLTSHADTVIPAKKKNITVDKKLKSENDTLPQKIVVSDTIPLNKNDSLNINKKDSLPGDTTALKSKADTLNFVTSKNAPDTVIEYSAEDSMVVNVPGKMITLYGKKATTQYKDNNLTAPIITLDQETGNIIASIKRDSTGKVISLPTYKQGDFLSESDSIKFNMKSGKGLTKSTYTTQGEMYVYGQTIKKVDNNVFYALRGRFTTCNLDTPHFAFVSNKIKFINNKMAITGPVHPEFEGVPIPIYFPFGIYPLNQERHSGLLQATFTTNQQRGLGLENLGYYKVISDYWDVIFRTSIYSYGGWTFSVNPTYKKNYRYNGRLQFDVQNFNTNFKGDPDFSHNRSYHIAWSHSMDSKARPGVTFSANVNAGSSSYNRNVPNEPQLNYSNQLYSSIAYSKTWKDKPFNLTVTANHNQNTNLKIINVELPTVGFNVATIYPFRKKDFVGTPKWYENIGIAYNGNAQNRFSFYDTARNIFKQIADTLQYGFHHSVPISLSLPQIGAFQVGPSVSYDETWYQTKTRYSWDAVNKRLDTSVQKGFYAARQMTFGLSVSTRIFGLITAKNKNAKIMAVRHEITPTFGISYKPEFNKTSFYSVQYDTAGHRQQFSVYQRNNIFGPYSPGRFGGLNFGIDNNISMKVRNKKDTGQNAIKKISILDGLSINGSYNFFADSLSFPLSDFPISLRTNLFNKINITASGILDPYEIDAQGRRIRTLVWKRKFLTLGRLISGNISLSTSLQGGNKKDGSKKAELTSNTNDINDLGYTQDQYDAESAYIRNNPGEFADFSIPWSVNLSYSLTYSKNFTVPQGYVTTFSQNVNFGGTLGITKKWQASVNGYYNITQGQINTISGTLSRDMHCWQMSISLSPVGIYRFFSISISPKSALLRDLRVNRTRYFYNNL
ncbi:LPS-assembly protein LptD [Ginsengibacter hankyongi]|uniref:LPS-assembly protein LptD n=1 Tax=Ginsengibacter hankyongi TaxID=2607284 RepID=A0A5J5IKT9_9BACT|nr:putative LPS assembly protein LptD [Ginsengibacter hankyongi]KAA9040687.1 LPS-assembly protein LptD [Ginsengibacter hankyongi]